MHHSKYQQTNAIYHVHAALKAKECRFFYVRKKRLSENVETKNH